MKIGIDARLLSTPIRGTSRYLSNLMQYLPKIDNENEYYVFQYEDLPRDNRFYTYVPIKKSKLPRQIYEHYWLNFSLPHLISEFNIDVFFTPYMFVPFIKRNWKNVIVIADSLTKVCKQYYTYHYRKYMNILVPHSIKRSDAIITISESAKQDIVKYYRVSLDKIQVLYLWSDYKYRPISILKIEKENFLKRYNLPEKYVLFVSVLEERKNVDAIIKVSDNLVSKGIDLKFVLVGRKGFGFKKMASELEKRKHRIIHLKDIIDEDLILLYNLATIFFFPSHYEGFGLPPLEAMKCGIPVIASDNSSLPEVIGDGGLLGGSNDYEFFANSIIKLLSDEKFYITMRRRAFEQAKKFTPEAHVTKLISTFNSLK